MQSGSLRWESARCPSPPVFLITRLWAARVSDLPNDDAFVSQFHAEVYFDQEQQSYVLVDQGSQNGTVINGNRILQVSRFLPSYPTKKFQAVTIRLPQPKTKCEPHALMHGDEVKMGETVLSFHIHSGTDTCDGCEPGQVMAHLSKHKTDEKPGEANGPDQGGGCPTLFPQMVPANRAPAV